MKIVNYSFDIELGKPHRFEIDFEMDDHRILRARGEGKFTFDIIEPEKYYKKNIHDNPPWAMK